MGAPRRPQIRLRRQPLRAKDCRAHHLRSEDGPELASTGRWRNRPRRATGNHQKTNERDGEGARTEQSRRSAARGGQEKIQSMDS